MIQNALRICTPHRLKQNKKARKGAFLLFVLIEFIQQSCGLFQDEEWKKPRQGRREQATRQESKT